MMESRQALEDHQRVKGFGSSSEYLKLSQSFKKATEKYLALSQPEWL